MTDFEEMVTFLQQECVHWRLVNGIDWNVRRYTMKARFGLTKDFYVDFEKKKCSMWHNEIKDRYFSTERLYEVMHSDFKTHIDIQNELDKIL